MPLIARQVALTQRRLEELKEARKAAQKASRQAYRQMRADRERKAMLAGEAILRRVERGEFDAAGFRAMMDESVSRPADRALFDLE